MSQDMSRDISKAPFVRVEVEPGDQLTRLLAFHKRGDARRFVGRYPSRRRLAGYVSDFDGVFIYRSHRKHLVVMAIIGCDAGQAMLLGISIPFGDDLGQIVLLGPDDFFGVFSERGDELWKPHRIRKRALQPELERAFVFYIGVVVVDFQPVQLISWPIRTLLDVTQENVTAVAPDDIDIFFARGGSEGFDRLHRE